MEKMMNTLTMFGKVDVDCQNPDKTICDRFLQQAQELLAKSFLNYLPTSANGDTNPLVLADKDKAVNTSIVKVAAGIDMAQAERIGKFTLDFNNTVYSSVHTQVQVQANKLDRSVLDPAIEEKLERP
jgi:hypothetical protein